MAQQPLLDVTVIMPAFNRAHLIVRALESVRRQRCWPRELIVIDDASQDNTVHTVTRWAHHTGFPVRIERLSTNGGAAAARNWGMKLAATTYIALLDSDDEHLPATLEKLVHALDGHPDAVVAFGDATKKTPTSEIANAMFLRRVQVASVSNPSTRDPHVFYLKDAKAVLLKSSLVPTCATCFRRVDALAVGAMPAHFRTGEDWMFWLKMSQRGRFVFYKEDLAVVHRHPENLTGPHSAEMTLRQKLIGYAALLDGGAGITLSDGERSYIDRQMDEYAAQWRYQLSRLGLLRYVAGLRQAHALTGKSLLVSVIFDPKSIVRALAASAGALPPLAPE